MDERGSNRVLCVDGYRKRRGKRKGVWERCNMLGVVTHPIVVVEVVVDVPSVGGGERGGDWVSSPDRGGGFLGSGAIRGAMSVSRGRGVAGAADAGPVVGGPVSLLETVGADVIGADELSSAR